MINASGDAPRQTRGILGFWIARGRVNVLSPLGSATEADYPSLFAYCQPSIAESSDAFSFK